MSEEHTQPPLPDRLLACADEVEQHPHPSHCDHLHDAASLLREAAAALSGRVPEGAMARALEWVRELVAEMNHADDPEVAQHLPAIEEAIAAYDPARAGARSGRVNDGREAVGASGIAAMVCEARNAWAEKHEANWLEDQGPHPDDFIGQWIAERLTPNAALTWEAKYRYLLTLIDAAEQDDAGMSGVAFSAQTPLELFADKPDSEIAALLCDDAIPTTPQPGDGWRPIAEAPEKAGRYLVSDGDDVREARWKPRSRRWVFPSAQGGIMPTTWREMPAAPSAKGVDRG